MNELNIIVASTVRLCPSLQALSGAVGTVKWLPKKSGQCPWGVLQCLQQLPPLAPLLQQLKITDGSCHLSDQVEVTAMLQQLTALTGLTYMMWDKDCRCAKHEAAGMHALPSALPALTNPQSLHYGIKGNSSPQELFDVLQGSPVTSLGRLMVDCGSKSNGHDWRLLLVEVCQACPLLVELQLGCCCTLDLSWSTAEAAGVPDRAGSQHQRHWGVDKIECSDGLIWGFLAFLAPRLRPLRNLWTEALRSPCSGRATQPWKPCCLMGWRGLGRTWVTALTLTRGAISQLPALRTLKVLLSRDARSSQEPSEQLHTFFSWLHCWTQVESLTINAGLVSELL